MCTPSKLQSFVRREQNWEGTASELAALLEQSDEPETGAPHLGSWLRQHEPTLWWDYGVHVRFSRTGRRRLVHLECRQSAAKIEMTAEPATQPSPDASESEHLG